MTVAPLVDLWGFGLKNRRVVRAAEVDSALACVGYEKVVMEGGVLRKLVPCVRIDAGAIAKGAACDVVLDSLRAHGCRDVCVEIGGEVAVWGVNRRGKEWRIGVNRPVEDSLSVVNEIEVVATLESGRGMATSGNYRNYYEMGGRKFSHTIDPKSGYPVRHSMLSATVVAPDCMTADAWATACMVAGLDSARRWVSERAELEAYLIYDSAGVMRSWYSAGFPKCD